jgi:hypothetical protein
LVFGAVVVGNVAFALDDGLFVDGVEGDVEVCAFPCPEGCGGAEFAVGEAEDLLGFAVFPIAGAEDDAGVFLADAVGEEHEPGGALGGVGSEDFWGEEDFDGEVEVVHGEEAGVGGVDQSRRISVSGSMAGGQFLRPRLMRGGVLLGRRVWVSGSMRGSRWRRMGRDSWRWGCGWTTTMPPL